MPKTKLNWTSFGVRRREIQIGLLYIDVPNETSYSRVVCTVHSQYALSQYTHSLYSVYTYVRCTIVHCTLRDCCVNRFNFSSPSFFRIPFFVRCRCRWFVYGFICSFFLLLQFLVCAPCISCNVQFVIHQWEWQWCHGIEVIFDERVFFFSIFSYLLVRFVYFNLFCLAPNALHCCSFVFFVAFVRL